MQRDELSSKEQFRDALAFWSIELATTIIIGAHALLRAVPHFAFYILHSSFPKTSRDAAAGKSSPAAGPVTKEREAI